MMRDRLVLPRTKKEDENVDNQNGKDNSTTVKQPSRLSVKDLGVILSMSTLLSFSLVMGVLGVNGVSEKLSQNSLMEVMMIVSVFIGLFTFISFILVKMAVHLFVYLAVGTFCALIFPVSRRRQRRAIEEIYSKAEKRD